MTFNFRKITLAWRIGLLLSLLATTMVAENLYAFQAEEAGEAAAMLRDGVQVTATPQHAVDRITVAVGFGFQRAFSVHYTFLDAQGRRWTGGGNVTEPEFAALADPAQPDSMRPDARLAVLYDPADPTRNGLRSAYEREPGPRLWMVITAFCVVLGTGLLFTWRADMRLTRSTAARRNRTTS